MRCFEHVRATDRLLELTDSSIRSGGRLADILKVNLPNGVVLASVNLLELKTVLEIVLVSLSLAYTIWRWRREYKPK